MSIADEFERLFTAWRDGGLYAAAVHRGRLANFVEKHGSDIVRLLRIGEENE